jgi:hypothetical protein
MPSKSPNAYLGVPAPEWTEFYGRCPERVVQLVGTPQHLRSMMAALKVKTASLVPVIMAGLANVRNDSVKTSDGSSIAVRIYTPDDGKATRPAVV